MTLQFIFVDRYDPKDACKNTYGVLRTLKKLFHPLKARCDFCEISKYPYDVDNPKCRAACLTTFHCLRSQNVGKMCCLLRLLSLRGVSQNFLEVIIRCSKYLRDASGSGLSNPHRFVTIRRIEKI